MGMPSPQGKLELRFYQANDFKNALDPFMGGGTTIGEALCLGSRAIGVDINPVSWFLVKKIVEPVSLRALDQAYRTLEQTVGQEILRFSETTCPQCQGAAQAVYTYWVKQVSCRACGHDALAEALKRGGFCIQRIWPVHAEMDVGVLIYRYYVVHPRANHIVAFDPESQLRRNGDQWIRSFASPSNYSLTW